MKTGILLYYLRFVQYKREIKSFGKRSQHPILWAGSTLSRKPAVGQIFLRVYAAFPEIRLFPQKSVNTLICIYLYIISAKSWIFQK